MIEAYKIVLRESGSVRRAEELARRMKAKSQQEVPNTSQHIRIVSEEIDKMQEDLQKVFYVDGDPDLSKKTAVKLIRSQRETKISFTFKGGVEETEERLQRVYKAITS